MPHKILILLSDTGGGHRASAQALEAEFARRHGTRFSLTSVDLLSDYLRWPLNRLPRTYPFLTNRTAWLWKFLWHLSARDDLSAAVSRVAAIHSRSALLRLFRDHAPDLVISTHPLVQELGLQTLRRIQLDIPFVTVITDLANVHPRWYHRDVDLCFVAGDEAYDRARRAGLSPLQLRSYGLPVHPSFRQQPDSRSQLRRELGMHPELPAALVVGGGDGIGPIRDIARQVALALAEDGCPTGQLIIICGRNRTLQQSLMQQRWPVPVQVRGFVQNMAAWMAASDCLVTKAGPGAIAEALVLGLPMLLTGYIPGQEEGNVPFVVEHGAGVYCEEPAAIAALVKSWFGPHGEQLATMASAARQLGQPHAAAQIVDEIVAYFDTTRRASPRNRTAPASTVLAIHRT